MDIININKKGYTVHIGKRKQLIKWRVIRDLDTTEERVKYESDILKEVNGLEESV